MISPSEAKRDEMTVVGEKKKETNKARWGKDGMSCASETKWRTKKNCGKRSESGQKAPMVHRVGKKKEKLQEMDQRQKKEENKEDHLNRMNLSVK